MGLPNFIKSDIIKTVLKKVSSDPDTQTTVLGVAGGALLAANVDWGKVIGQHDGVEIGKAVGALIVAIFGFYTNKPKK